MKFYHYLFYRIADFWIRTDKTKDMNPFYDEKHNLELGSAAAIVSLIQFSNLNAILIIPFKIINLFLSESFIQVIFGIIIVYNIFISNLQNKYVIAKEIWGYESVKQRKIRGVCLIFFMIISIALLCVAYKTIYK